MNRFVVAFMKVVAFVLGGKVVCIENMGGDTCLRVAYETPFGLRCRTDWIGIAVLNDDGTVSNSIMGKYWRPLK